MSATIIHADTRDGHRFDVRVCAAQTPSRHLLFFPAMGVAAKYYDRFGAALAAQGITVGVADLRGHGSSSLRAGRATDWGYETMIQQDWAQARLAFAHYTGAQAISLGGHSLGGQLSCLYAAAYPQQVHSLLLIAACTVQYSGWVGTRAIGMRYAVRSLMPLVSSLVGYFPGDKLGFAGREARTQMHDWARNIPAGLYHPKGGPAYEPMLDRLAVPVTAISMEGDDFAPRAAVENLLRKLPSCSVNHIHMGAQDGVPAGVLDHFKWAKEADCVAAVVARHLA